MTKGIVIEAGPKKIKNVYILDMMDRLHPAELNADQAKRIAIWNCGWQNNDDTFPSA